MTLSKNMSMKERVTLSLEPEYLKYLDQLASQWGKSRSAALRTLLREHIERHRRAKLAAQAEKFFSQPEAKESVGERAAWERAGFEVWACDEDDSLAAT